MKTYKNRKNVQAAVLAFAAWGWTSIAAQSPTRLQVIFTQNAEESKQVAKRVDDAGMGPAFVAEGDGGYRVFTRPYPSYAEANLAKPILRKVGFSDCFSVSEDGAKLKSSLGSSSKSFNADHVFGTIDSANAQDTLHGHPQIDFELKKQPIERPEMTESLRSLDNKSAAEGELLAKGMAFRRRAEAREAIEAFSAFAARFPNSHNRSKALIMRAYWRIEAGDKAEAEKEFEQIARDYAHTEAAGEARLRCAYLKLSDRASEALQDFLQVAKAEIPAADAVRVEAMLRCAALYSRAKDLDTADACYSSIENLAADPEIKGFAAMQRAGINLEKAYNGQVSYEVARQQCGRVLEEYPGVNIQILSTANLMLMETLSRENRHDDVILESEKFFAEYENTPEAPLAHYWVALAYEKTGRTKTSQDLAADVLNGGAVSSNRFKVIDLEASAAKLINAAGQRQQ